MTTETYALLYRSRATTDFGDRETAHLALRSAQANARAAVTGVLLYADVEPGRPEIFVQWLEGSRDAVREIYDRIRADDRHADVETIAEGPTAELVGRDGRLFPDWGMRYERVGAVPLTLEGFLEDWLANRPEARPSAGGRGG